MPTESPDLYSVLGVLPSAEHVVVVAAYRALAQRYHPDKWTGAADEANRRMAELNSAYHILSDPNRRKQYDDALPKAGQADFGTAEEQGDAFATALQEAEARWRIACDIYPDLIDYELRLQKVSIGLAFSYVSHLLTTKRFTDRAQLASQMEEQFLQRYFSTDEGLLRYARRLIDAGLRDAAKALNDLIDVVGVPADPDRLVAKIEAQFGLESVWTTRANEQKRRDHIASLVGIVRHYTSFPDASQLAHALGYTVNVVGQGLFKSVAVSVTSPNSEELHFKSRCDFAIWATVNLCGK